MAGLTYTGSHQRDQMRYKSTKDLGINNSDITKKALQTSGSPSVAETVADMCIFKGPGCSIHSNFSLLSLNNNHAKIFKKLVYTEFPFK